MTTRIETNDDETDFFPEGYYFLDQLDGGRLVKKPSPIAGEIVAGLADFADLLERGEPIPATQVRKRNTPDGLLHTAESVTLRKDGG